MRAAPRFKDGLDVFARHRVEVIVVGGVAAVLNGAPISTVDLDLVHLRTVDNLARLGAALLELDARYRDPGGRVIRPDPLTMAGDGHHLLLTNCGPIDLLGRIGHGRAYEDLRPDTEVVRLAGHEVRILTLGALIRTKEEAGRAKDHAVLAVLRRTLLERG
jgi:hypothetical protein